MWNIHAAAEKAIISIVDGALRPQLCETLLMVDDGRLPIHIINSI